MPTAAIRLLRKRDLIIVGPTFLSGEVVHDKAGRAWGGSADLGPGSGRCRNSRCDLRPPRGRRLPLVEGAWRLRSAAEA